MERFVEQGGVGGFPHAIDDDDSTVWQAFDVTSQPAFVFVNDDGTFETLRGTLDEEALAEKVAALKAK